jgi:hypothetical protein
MIKPPGVDGTGSEDSADVAVEGERLPSEDDELGSVGTEAVWLGESKRDSAGGLSSRWDKEVEGETEGPGADCVADLGGSRDRNACREASRATRR